KWRCATRVGKRHGSSRVLVGMAPQWPRSSAVCAARGRARQWHGGCNSRAYHERIGLREPLALAAGRLELRGANMNTDILQGRWEQLKGKARIKWGKLTNDDIDQIKGERQKLVGKLREKYGLAQERAEQDVDDWLETHH